MFLCCRNSSRFDFSLKVKDTIRNLKFHFERIYTNSHIEAKRILFFMKFILNFPFYSSPYFCVEMKNLFFLNIFYSWFSIIIPWVVKSLGSYQQGLLVQLALHKSRILFAWGATVCYSLILKLNPPGQN